MSLRISFFAVEKLSKPAFLDLAIFMIVLDFMSCSLVVVFMAVANICPPFFLSNYGQTFL